MGFACHADIPGSSPDKYNTSSLQAVFTSLQSFLRRCKMIIKLERGHILRIILGF